MAVPDVAGKKKMSSSSRKKRLIEEECSDEVEVISSNVGSRRKRPRRAKKETTNIQADQHFNEKEQRIEVKDSVLVESEDVAVVSTAEDREQGTPQRRLTDFLVHDEQGAAQPIEILEAMPLYLTAVVSPLSGPLTKQRGVKCASFGPLSSWCISGYEEGSPVIWVCTDIAEYICVKPAGSYKRCYGYLWDKAMVCVAVYKALSKPDGGNPHLSLDDVIARLSRSLSGNSSFNQVFNREYFFSIGNLVVEQLVALDENASDGEQVFSGLSVLEALKSESLKRPDSIMQEIPSKRSGALVIHDEPTATSAAANSSSHVESDSTTNDEKLALILQEQENLQSRTTRIRRGTVTPKAKVYIKINEDEIVADYPLPDFYKAEEEEMDEYILFDDDTHELDPADLPRRILHDWCLYNSDFRLMPLELLPMVTGAETDVEIFGSGLMTEDDGGGYCVDGDDVQMSSASETNSPHGIRIYLSAIKEWMIEFGASMLFISIRTDGAWYRLGKPSELYAPWYRPVLKTARLAMKIITMLKNASRVSRLSFSDVVKRLSEQPDDSPTFISSKILEVQRYVVVHGQIILQQFAEYPDGTIQKSSFGNGLSEMMMQRHHTKLSLSKKKIVVKKGKNLNPRACLQPDAAKSKPMRATTTQLINRIWSEYYAEADGGDKEKSEAESGCKEDKEEEDEDDENLEAENIIPNVMKPEKTSEKSRTAKSKPSRNHVKWVGKSTGKTCKGDLLYHKASFGKEHVEAGKVLLVGDEGTEIFVLVEYLYDGGGSSKWMAHGRVLERGTNTMLDNAANKRELFLTNQCEDVSIEDAKLIVEVEIRKRDWGYSHRKQNAMKDEEDRKQATEREKNSLAPQYFCRALYAPNDGAFYSLPHGTFALGTGVCNACKQKETREAKMGLQLLPNDEGFRLDGVDYKINDYLYVESDLVQVKSSEKELEKFKAGRNKGLRAFAVCQLLGVQTSSASSKKRNSAAAALLMTVRRFYRPEDVDITKAYKADIRVIYYSEETKSLPLRGVRGKCNVLKQLEVSEGEFQHTFSCSCIYDPKKGTVKTLPANIKLGSRSFDEKSKEKASLAAKAKGKGKLCEEDVEVTKLTENKNKLTTLDVFAGCGGLSEGLHQAGVTYTKWAIEYDNAAAEAYKLNHPNAEVFCDNCNVILRSIMENGGDVDDCISTPEAEELSSKLTKEKKDMLPTPGQVEFITGGPPCQGFSGMNRFNQRAWSKVQCEMILAFLSYADYLRPRYFLLENVRNFVSFNKGQAFRLTVASLLEMGYQVRFGILQAGNYGVSQSRTRAFIWAAAPGETLPDWPQPVHVFASSHLKIPLPRGADYSAVKDGGVGAPLRSVTVRDAIADLPPVVNGAEKRDTTYGKDPESWFQKHARGIEKNLRDHICKEMNELNYIRCQRIPKQPGADWRDLPEEKVKLSSGQTVDLIPWCLPNTAERHNQWKGLFGRLDWDGNFPTSVTDPQPMGKVGMCFHPEQDRIVTVRECARSQGFPDCYKFFGSIQNKHRQIGNAVPPPLAKALGEMLKIVVSNDIN